MINRYKILIIEDHPIVCQAYQLVLQQLTECEKDIEFKVLVRHTLDKANQLIINNLQSMEKFDILLLDMRIPEIPDGEIINTEKFAISIRQKMPDIRIVIITSLTNSFRLFNIFKSINPASILIKSEIDNKELSLVILKVIRNQTYYSNSLMKIFRRNNSSSLSLDEIDRKILYHLSKGIRTKELPKILPLSISGIEKRKRRMMKIFQLKSVRTSELLKMGEELGYI